MGPFKGGGPRLGAGLVAAAALAALGADEPRGRADALVRPASVAPGPLGRPARTPPGGAPSGASWAWPAIGMALAFAGLGCASWAARRRGAGEARGAGSVRVIGRTYLAPKQAVHLVQAGGRLLIVGTGPGGPPSLLSTLPDPAKDETAGGGGA